MGLKSHELVSRVIREKMAENSEMKMLGSSLLILLCKML